MYFGHNNEWKSHNAFLHIPFRLASDMEDKDDSHGKLPDTYAHKEEEYYKEGYIRDNFRNGNNDPEFWHDDNEKVSDRVVDKEDRGNAWIPCKELR